MHMALFRVHKMVMFISAQVSEIFHEPLGICERYGDECTRNNAICIFSHDFRCFVHLVKRLHNFIFHQSARWVYLGPGVKVGSLFWSARTWISILITIVEVTMI